MRGMTPSIYKITLTLTITMMLLSVILIPSLPKDSAEYVITVLSLGINVVLTAIVVICIKRDIKKSRF